MTSFIVPIFLAFIATCQGITIRLPVMTNPISGMFAPSSSWGSCNSEQKAFHGMVQSNKDCAMEKLMSVCEFSEQDAQMLLNLANSIISRHPMARGEVVGADSGAKKCMCKVASECKCTITQDWCSDRDLKKKARKMTNKKKSEEKAEDKKIKNSEKEENDAEIHKN
ncbi:uncharacterized protein LOC135683677 [Rhopilema esculentum]|uniref:uncharacterized protein LOC135683677 n=1 Tax=Rhopilema esculentum TaxID=499914 RepID=UPI0031DD1DCF